MCIPWEEGDDESEWVYGLEEICSQGFTFREDMLPPHQLKVEASLSSPTSHTRHSRISNWESPSRPECKQHDFDRWATACASCWGNHTRTITCANQYNSCDKYSYDEYSTIPSSNNRSPITQRQGHKKSKHPTPPLVQFSKGPNMAQIYAKKLVQ